MGLPATEARLLIATRDGDSGRVVQAWRNLRRFRGESAPFTWLYRISVNEALMQGRGRRRRREKAVASVESRVHRGRMALRTGLAVALDE